MTELKRNISHFDVGSSLLALGEPFPWFYTPVNLVTIFSFPVNLLTNNRESIMRTLTVHARNSPTIILKVVDQLISNRQWINKQIKFRSYQRPLPSIDGELQFMEQISFPTTQKIPRQFSLISNRTQWEVEIHEQSQWYFFCHTVSPVITAFHSCCLSLHVFDQVNLWPVWVGFETAIFWQCAPGTVETQRLYPLRHGYGYKTQHSYPRSR